MFIAMMMHIRVGCIFLSMGWVCVFITCANDLVKSVVIVVFVGRVWETLSRGQRRLTLSSELNNKNSVKANVHWSTHSPIYIYIYFVHKRPFRLMDFITILIVCVYICILKWTWLWLSPVAVVGTEVFIHLLLAGGRWQWRGSNSSDEAGPRDRFEDKTQSCTIIIIRLIFRCCKGCQRPHIENINSTLSVL